MTNNDIIFQAVATTFTAEQIADIVSACFTPEQINSRRADVHKMAKEIGLPEISDSTIFAEMAAETFHTFAEWKRCGFAVKKGEHAAITCNLWKHTSKPSKKAVKAAEESGNEAPESSPHFYMTKASLFSRLQVEAVKA